VPIRRPGPSTRSTQRGAMAADDTYGRLDGDDYPPTPWAGPSTCSAPPGASCAPSEKPRCHPAPIRRRTRCHSLYQLRIAARARELVDQGTSIEAACRGLLSRAPFIDSDAGLSSGNRSDPETTMVDRIALQAAIGNLTRDKHECLVMHQWTAIPSTRSPICSVSPRARSRAGSARPAKTSGTRSVTTSAREAREEARRRTPHRRVDQTLSDERVLEGAG
jgi:hypothetical protein